MIYNLNIDNIRNFKPISSNRKIHHLYTSKSGEIVVSDLSCYTCDKCIVSDYEHCLHTEHTGGYSTPQLSFFSRRQCLKTRSNFKHVVFYIVILCLNRNNRIRRNKFSDVFKFSEDFIMTILEKTLNIQINSKKTSHCSCIISVVYLCLRLKTKLQYPRKLI
jgi:hypothetical protein